MLTQQKTPWSVIGDFHGDRKNPDRHSGARPTGHLLEATPGTEARDTRGSQTARQQQYSAVHRAASFLTDSDTVTGHSIREAGRLDKG